MVRSAWSSVCSSTLRPASRPYLAVRGGRIIVPLVPVEEVETVDADESLIVLVPARLVPELHGDELVLRPRDEPAPLAAAV